MTPYGRNKIILLDERFATGEPTVQPVVLWGPRGRACYETLSKEASASPALDYIRHVQPTPGRTVVLIIGLGSYEWYGLNRNGDGFNEQPYKIGVKPSCGCCGKGRDAWVLENECIQHHYQSYEQGHAFLHHCNKDPARAVGKILKAFWNPYMHRVEVLEDIENNKAPELVERISDGQFPAKSMGTRIKFDVCTKCGHHAPTRKHYCDHLKWSMGQLDPSGSGLRFGALNPAPRFFDSSWVVRPADRTCFMLKKVAMAYEVQGYTSSELGDLVDDLNNKSAAVKKLADIDKIIRGYPASVVQSSVPEAGLIQKYRDTALPSVVENTPHLKNADLSALAQHPSLAETLAALSRAGIILTTPEFIKLFIEKASPGTHIPQHVLEQLTALQAEIFECLSQQPALLNDLMETLTVETPQSSESLQQTIEPLLEKRSTVSRYLTRRYVPRHFRMEEAPYSKTIEVQDPYNGQLYVTTQGAVNAAEDEIAKAKLRRLAGSAALLSGAYKALTVLPSNAKIYSVPLGAAGLLAARGLADEEASFTSTEGQRVPALTEFHTKQGHLLDTVNTLGMDYELTKKGSALLQRIATRTSRKESPLHYFMQKLSSFGLYYPTLSLARLIDTSDKVASNGIVGEQLNLEKLAEVIGTLAWETP